MMLRLAIILISLLFSFSAFAYTPPIGIPDPADYWTGFGEIDQASPTEEQRNTICSGWPTGEASNCWYIDYDHASCTDTVGAGDSNPRKGYPDKPRCSIRPTTALGDVSATGGIVYIDYAAGHEYSDYTVHYFSGIGAAAKPIWIMGSSEANKPIIPGTVEISGPFAASQWIIIENIKITPASNSAARILIYSDTDSEGFAVDHILARKLHVDGEGTSTTHASQIGTNKIKTTDVVIYDCIFENIGPYDGNPSNEQGGTEIAYNYNTWILNNTESYITEDGVGGCHTCDDNVRPKYIFVGGNTFNMLGSNCVDFKNSEGIIISENDCYGPPNKTDDASPGFGLHYGGNTIYRPVDAWVIFNKIHDRAMGIRLSGFENKINIIGNVIYDINWTRDTGGKCTSSAGECGVGISILNSAMGTEANIIDNTFYNNDSPIQIYRQIAETETLNIYGNLMASRAESSRYDIDVGANATPLVAMDYNLFYTATDNADIFYANNAHTLTQLKDHVCTNCVESDPKLTALYALQSTSTAAIGANSEHAVYNAFAAYWTTAGFTGLSIKKDRLGTTRPQQTTWDIGAYEYDPATVRSAMSIGAGAGVSIGSGATMTLY